MIINLYHVYQVYNPPRQTSRVKRTLMEILKIDINEEVQIIGGFGSRKIEMKKIKINHISNPTINGDFYHILI